MNFTSINLYTLKKNYLNFYSLALLSQVKNLSLDKNVKGSFIKNAKFNLP